MELGLRGLLAVVSVAEDPAGIAEVPAFAGMTEELAGMTVELAAVAGVSWNLDSHMK